MKKTFKILTVIGVAIMLLNGCGSSSSSKEETPAPVVATLATTCTLEQGVPTGYSMGVMHTSCTGEQSIESATVTIDGVVKIVDFVAGATSIDDYMSFYNLQPDTTYQGELNIVANGEPLEPVFGNLVTGSYETPAPTPAPEPEVTPEPEPVVNTEPTAQDLTVNAAGAETVSGTIVIGDAEDAVSSLTVVVASSPAHGSIVWNSKTNFTYTVTDGSGYNGDDSFTYYVEDSGSLQSATKTVTIEFVVDR